MFILAYHSPVLYINCPINIYLAGVELTYYLGGYVLYILGCVGDGDINV
jgi:hypothetical protein